MVDSPNKELEEARSIVIGVFAQLAGCYFLMFPTCSFTRLDLYLPDSSHAPSLRLPRVPLFLCSIIQAFFGLFLELTLLGPGTCCAGRRSDGNDPL